jgi:hypothetical protein
MCYRIVWGVLGSPKYSFQNTKMENPCKVLLNILSFSLNGLLFQNVSNKLYGKQMVKCVIELFGGLGSPKYSFQNTKRENHAKFS